MSAGDAFLFVAHDLGGARVLTPIIEKYRENGHAIAVFARGPAREVLSNEGPGDADGDIETTLASTRPGCVVTGTSESATLEQAVWAEAHRRHVPAIAFLDASINLAKRFGPSLPDAIGVVDKTARQEMKSITGGKVRVEVVGQPHLERIVELIDRNRSQNGTKKKFVYFSEPYVAAPGEPHPIGYEQFGVAGQILAGFAGCVGITLEIKPHPNEDPQRWHDWRTNIEAPVGLELNITATDALTLMRHSAGVLGLGSMALIEAALAGIPVLALQPERTYCPNPALDGNAAIELVTDPDAVVDATRGFVRPIAEGTRSAPVAISPFAGSTTRAIRFIEDTLALPASTTKSAS